MGQDILARPRWNILNSRLPATVSDVIDIILGNRNLEAADFTGELKDLAEHLCIRGMTEGAALLAKHMADRDKIVVVADYDCDGITSAAQMALFFQEIGYPTSGRNPFPEGRLWNPGASHIGQPRCKGLHCPGLRDPRL